VRYANLSRADLNLLVNFLVLMEERSVTAAGNRMFLSQPAMSRVLDRLRELFKDPLLVRTRRGYEATRRAENIYRQLERALPAIESVLTEGLFDPRVSVDRFRIAMTDNVALSLLPNVMADAVKHSEHIGVEIFAWKEDAFSRLIANALDLVIWIDEAPAPLRSEPLYEDEFVCLVRKDHPMAQGPLTVDKYMQMDHVVVSLSGSRQARLDASLSKRGYERQVIVPFFGAVPSLVERTDLIATVPKRLARETIKRSATQIIKFPIKLPRIVYIQVWHPRNENDAAHQWLRKLVKQVAAAG
jgi:DNA-binding transcriptional LysR family regulator